MFVNKTYFSPFLTRKIFGNIFTNQQVNIHYFNITDFQNNFKQFLTTIVNKNSDFSNIDKFDNLTKYDLKYVFYDDTSIHLEHEEIDENYKICEFIDLENNNLPYLSCEENIITNSYAFGNIRSKHCFVQTEEYFIYIHALTK
jgi:hypothetical protein